MRQSSVATPVFELLAGAEGTSVAMVGNCSATSDGCDALEYSLEVRPPRAPSSIQKGTRMLISLWDTWYPPKH